MLRRTWRGWGAAIALSWGVAVGTPAQGAEPETTKAPAAKATRRVSTSNYVQTARLFQDVFGPNSLHAADASSAKVLAFAAQGRLSDAINAAQLATDIQDRHATTLLATGSEEQKRLYMDKMVGQTYQNISLHVQYAPTNQRAARLAFTTLLRRKGRVLETMTDNLATLRRSALAADQTLAADLASIYSQLATRLSRGPENVSTEQYRKNITELEDERQKLEAKIARRSASFRMKKRLITIEEAQGALPTSAARLVGITSQFWN